MANIKISNLTTYTGTTKDIRWFVMNNSSNTETFKFSGFTAQIIPGSGTDSFVSINLPQSYATNNNMYIFGSTNIASSGQYSGIFAGRNNRTTAQFSSAIGGDANTVSSYGGAIIGGNTNVVSGNYSVIAGGNGNTLGNANGSAIVAGSGCIIQGNNDSSCSIFSSISSRMTENGTRGIYIVGGENHFIHSFHGTGGQGWRENYGGILGGYTNIITGPSGTGQVGANAYPTIIGGAFNSIFGITGAESSGTTIMNSFGSRIRAVSGATIIGGFNNTVSGSVQNVVMLGISGRTSEYSDTTHMEHTKTYRTESFGVTNAGNVGGNIDVNLSAGTLFTFTMTANTTPNFINWREGQVVQFFVYNSGSFTIPTITISGGGAVYAKGGSINPTNNGRTAYYGTIVNGNMWLDEHTNFIAL